MTEEEKVICDYCCKNKLKSDCIKLDLPTFEIKLAENGKYIQVPGKRLTAWKCLECNCIPCPIYPPISRRVRIQKKGLLKDD